MRLTIIILTYLLSCGGVVWALAYSTVAAAAYPLTLEETLALAQGNPTILASQAQKDAASAAVQTARAYPNPAVELMGGPSSSLETGGLSGPNAIALVAQPIELPSVRASRRDRAMAGLEAAEAATRNVNLIVQARVKQAFYEILRQQNEAEMALQNQILLEQIRDRVKLRVETGEAPRYELVKAEAEVLSATKNRERAELQVESAKSVLRALVGPKMPMDFEVKGELEAPDTLPPIEELRAILLERHPALVQLQSQLRQAQEQLRLEKNLRYPQPTLLAGFEHSPDLNQWRFGFSIPLPLWNQRQGPIAEAFAEVKETEAVAEQQRLVLLREMESAYTRYRIAARQEEAFETGLLSEAEYALRVAETAYRQGARGILDYLDAQRVYQAVRQDYINARFNKQIAYTEIERLLASGPSGYGE